MTVPLPSLPGSVNTSDQPWATANWFVTGNDGSIPGLQNRDQATVTTALQNNVQASPGWNASSSSLCSLITNNPIVGGLSSLGTGSTPTGLLFSGVQVLADALCGIFTGSSSTGTSPLTILTGVQNTTDMANTLVTGTSTTGNSISGVLGLFTTLLDDFCTLFSGTTSTGTSGASLLSGFTSVFSLLTSNPLFTELISLGSSGTNVIMQLLTGVMSFADSLCSLFTGTTSTGTAPSTVLGGAQTFIDTIFNLVTGGSSTGNSGTSILTEVISLIDSFVGILGGSGTGNPLSTLLSVATSFLSTLFGIFGGASSLGGIGTFITSLLGAFGGSSSTTGVGSFITNLLGSFGGATSTTGVGSFITNLLGSFGGATSTTGVGSFITNLLGAFGGATGTAGVGTFVTDLLGFFNFTGLGTGSPGLSGSTPSFLQPLIDAISGGFGGSSGLGIGGLTSYLSIIPGAQQLLDTVYQALTGDTSTGNPLSVITSLFSAFPAGNVIGAGGPATLADTWQHLLDQLNSGFNLSSLTGTGFADLLSSATSIAGTQAAHTSTLNIRNNSPMHFAPDGTTEGPFPLADLTGTLTTIPITPTTAAASFTRIRADTVKTKIEWISTGWTGTLTGFYLTANTQDPITGTLTKLWTSPNQLSSLTNAAAHWESYDIPATDQQLFPASQAVNIEAMITGTSTPIYNIAAKQVAVPAHPTALPSAWGAVRNNANAATAPSTISGGAIGYSANVPYLGLSSDMSSYHTPVTEKFTSSGTYTPPPWALFLDRIVVGGGHGGKGGQSAFIVGTGGLGGTWNADTIDLTATPVSSLSVTVGAGGAGGAGGGTFSQPLGSPGGDSIVSGTGVPTLTGAGATGYNSGNPGLGPGPETYNSQMYPGGGTQSSAGSAGNPPGGGSAGGGSVWYFGLAAGNAADGVVYIVARMS